MSIARLETFDQCRPKSFGFGKTLTADRIDSQRPTRWGTLDRVWGYRRVEDEPDGLHETVPWPSYPPNGVATFLPNLTGSHRMKDFKRLAL
jgi:hypothetical protein